jgi:LAO/AO transport system kinase
MTAPARRPSARELADGLLAGNRTLLARAITMVESRRPDDQAVALDLLDLILPHTGGSLPSRRLRPQARRPRRRP